MDSNLLNLPIFQVELLRFNNIINYLKCKRLTKAHGKDKGEECRPELISRRNADWGKIEALDKMKADINKPHQEERASNHVMDHMTPVVLEAPIETSIDHSLQWVQLHLKPFKCPTLASCLEIDGGCVLLLIQVMVHIFSWILVDLNPLLIQQPVTPDILSTLLEDALPPHVTSTR